MVKLKQARRLVCMGWLCLSCSVVFLLSSCDQGQPPRSAWIQQHLVDDNWLLMRRAPDLVEGKYKKMANHIYNYFRGTVRIYLHDISRPHALSMPTEFGSVASSQVVSVVDPHPENIGTYRSKDGVLTLDFNDFDGADYAPFHFDLRRLAVGFAIGGIVTGLRETNPEVVARALRRVSEGYVEEIKALAAGKAAVQIRWKKGFGTVIDDLFKRADEQGKAKEYLDEYTRLNEGKRELYYGVIEASDIDGVQRKVVEKLRPEEEVLVRRLVADYLIHKGVNTKTAASFYKIKGIARRYGAGVSSYPRFRYYILIEGPTDNVDDDLLLECKEMADLTPVPGTLRLPLKLFRSNGERVVSLQQRMQEFRENDEFLGWGIAAPMSFRIRHLTKYQKGFDILRFQEKFAEGKWKAEDYHVYAYQTGRLLARAHALVPTLQVDANDISQKGLDAIVGAIDGKYDELVEETTTFATAYAKQIEADFASFVELLKSKGPLLGVRSAPIRQDLP